MKKNLLFPVIAFVALGLQGNLHAQLTIPSDGSDGALNVTSANLEIDLEQAVMGTWSDNNAANTSQGIWDPNKRAIVFKYSSVNIAANRTVSFKNHPHRPPVVWLVQGDVNISGHVSLDGFAATGDSLGEPGPGGFRGGAYTSGAGLGPGGGNGIASFPQQPGKYASIYGNAQIIPLVGGSGSGGTGNSIYRSGGGGGAILIAAGGNFVLNGTIRANGANGASDGAVRIIADSIGGTGTIDLRDDGRVRLEANAMPGSLSTYPQTVAVTPASPPQIWPADDAPQCRIILVDAQPAPVNPTAPLGHSADISLAANAGQVVTIQTNKFPINGTVELRVAGKFTPNAETIPAHYQEGNFDEAFWTATVPFASGFTTLQARAFIPAPTP